MTDSKIADQHRSLCEAISDWTDSEFGDYENPFSVLQTDMAREGPAKLIHKYLVQGHKMAVVKAYPSAGCTMITFLTHRHPYQSILRESFFYPCLDAKCERFVSFVVGAMSQNPPRRGNDVSLFWYHR
jgi:hypothetical protein